jgi:chemotaxis methyl-accepting protein methylase
MDGDDTFVVNGSQNVTISVGTGKNKVNLTPKNGNYGFTIVTDLKPEDKIQLQGSASNYRLEVSDKSTILYVDKPVESDEIIGLFQNTTGLNLTSNTFDYVKKTNGLSAIQRFQNSNVPGTYLFAGESEAANIRANFKNFKEEGLAFQVAVEKSDPLMQPLFRFQNSNVPGTYLFAGESEAANIRANFKNFKEEGLAFYVFGVGSGQGTTFNRFQNTSMPGTYLFAGPEETVSILANSKNFALEGKAFEVG